MESADQLQETKRLPHSEENQVLSPSKPKKQPIHKKSLKINANHPQSETESSMKFIKRSSRKITCFNQYQYNPKRRKAFTLEGQQVWLRKAVPTLRESSQTRENKVKAMRVTRISQTRTQFPRREPSTVTRAVSRTQKSRVPSLRTTST